MNELRNLELRIAQLEQALDRQPVSKPRLIVAAAGTGGASKLFLTPRSGILAASGNTSKILVPSATCIEYEWSTTSQFGAVATVSSDTVYNIADVPIAGNVLIVANKIDDRWVVVVAQCGSGGSGSFQSWTQ